MTETPELIPLPDEGRTDIFKFTERGEDHVGFVGPDDQIYKLRWDKGLAIGRIERRDRNDGGNATRIFRNTRHDEKELGTVDEHGTIRSHGLFEGGELGWMDPDGVVVQGGLILGEEEVGRVEGPQAPGAAAALLLIFLPEDAEASREMQRR